MGTGAAPAIRPIYSLPAEVSQRLFASVVSEALQHCAHSELGAIPPEVRTRENLPTVTEAFHLGFSAEDVRSATEEALAAMRFPAAAARKDQ